MKVLLILWWYRENKKKNKIKSHIHKQHNILQKCRKLLVKKSFNQILSDEFLFLLIIYFHSTIDSWRKLVCILFSIYYSSKWSTCLQTADQNDISRFHDRHSKI